MKRLLSNEAQLRQVLNHIAHGITVQDATGHLIYANQAAADLLGCADPDEVLRKGGAKIVAAFKYYDEQGRKLSPADLPGRKALAGVTEPEMVVGYTSEEHPEMQWSAIKAMPVCDDDGQVILAVNVIQDITKIKLAELRLKEANERITKLLEATLR